MRIARSLLAAALALPGGARAASYSVIYSFDTAKPGPNHPNAGLTPFLGVLYGTSAYGGDLKACKGGCGTVYSLTPAGAVTQLYGFQSLQEGVPGGGLLAAGGKLYGNAFSFPNVGSAYTGDIYALSLQGTGSVLYTFKGARAGGHNYYDGRNAEGALILADNLLFGTTLFGGLPACQAPGSKVLGCGTVYEATLGGREKVLYRFKGGTSDGYGPASGVLFAGGAVYGTTIGGGSTCLCGTVFKLTLAGVETVLHAFTGKEDGGFPSAGLVAVNGLFYGTSQASGTYGGAVYSITPDGGFTVLHEFTGGTGDGYQPVGPLVALNGVLYGTTLFGGDNDLGTIFSITPGGQEQIVYSFGAAATDAAYPKGGLTELGGMLFGVAGSGGAYGFGAVFKYVP